MSESGRRLAAIMFTDMVGYTALAQADEPLALDVLARHHKLLRPIFPKFHGKEVKTIGDSFLVEFDSALDAANCAVEIQRYLRDYNASASDKWKVKLRIGVHLGDIVRAPGDILGDAVNIASRIEPLAQPEGVCLSEQVFDQVRNKLSQPIIKLDSVELKNVRFPIDVYRIVMPWEESVTQRQFQERTGRLRVAVLPFANMSVDPENEYFADGMTEELIDRLSQVRGLKVIARTSVMGYKKKEKNVSEIAKELGVGTLVEGSVRKPGKKVRITLQLIDANTEEHLWSSKYDRDLDDVFAIQTEISEKVTEQLRVHIVDSEKRLLEKIPTTSTEAYTLYLKGRYYWNQRNRVSVEKGIEYLKKSLQMDPNLALAYSDLADAYVVLGEIGNLPAHEARQRVQEYASKALAIDPSLSQPHAALAVVHGRSFNWPEAENGFERAIELNPNNATARHWYAQDLLFQGKKSAAIEQWRKALEIDPLSQIIGTAFGYNLVRAGQNEEGFKLIHAVLEMNESFVWGHRNMAMACLLAGLKDEALAEAKKLLALAPHERAARANVAAVYARTGHETEAVEILNGLLKESETQYTDPSNIAMVYAALGDEPKALTWLRRAVMEISGGVPYMVVWPAFNSLKNNPEFRKLTEKIGLRSES
ncbi:MAG TPA: adenylate/guanylate cyclase domain-containing protein [Candidatus Angelobacter sp.]|nr:adenylate/guanylate cyclase domain-containing protein [Candidatus Angelobacter sp.]